MFNIDPKIFPKADGAFLVGGSIRDMLCGRSPVDYDVAVLGDPLEFARQIAARAKGRLVEIGKPGQMIIRMVSDSVIVDIAQAKEAAIQNDLMTRDFTINAMAYDLSARQLVDPLGARLDLNRGIIRMVSEDIFKRDPVRLLRAYRIAAQFAFEIEPKTKAAIEENATHIRQAAAERVRDEFFKMLQSAGSHLYLCQMVDNDLLFAILPELADLKNCRQNQHHQFNALEHTLLAYYQLEGLLNPGVPPATGAGVKLALGIAATQFPLLKFCMLIHDIGKPSTQKADRNGRLHFYGHERRSGQMATHICRRLKCSNHFIETTRFLVQHHARPRNLYTALQEQKATPRALTRFFIKCGAYLPELLVMAAADTLGKATKLNRHSNAFMTFLDQLMLDFENDFRPRASEPKLITGQDLIAEFGLNPSAVFKKIIDRVEEERLSRKDMTRQEAVKLVSELIQNQGSTEEE